MISEQHENHIIEEINRSAIKSQRLKDDLVDHFCCLVEIEMNNGATFDDALAQAYLQTSPNGLDEIQQETIFLFNYSNIMFVKRLMYAVGYLFSLMWIVGILFKLMHLPGAMILMFSGGSGFVFIFLPMLLVNRYKKIAREVLTERLKWIFGFVSFALFMFASYMKLFHFQGAELILALSFLAFGFGFLPFLFFRMYRKSLDEF